MSRHQKDIFSKENKYEKNIFSKFRDWFKQRKKWQKGLLIGGTVLLIVVIGLGSFIFSKLDMMNRVEINDGKLSCVDVDGYINILLLGVDTRDMSNVEGAGADAIMILSIKEDTGDVKLMSVYRDTYLKMGDEEYYDKITNANRVGGPELMMKTLNQAMDLNISKFAVVNFKSVADLVDAVGGITVDIQDYEIEQLNKYTKQTAKNIGKENYQLVKEPGTQTIEGVQAVSYGRIRKGVGDDYKRTERMRIVITKVFEKVKTMSVGELNNILNLMMPQVQTNLSNNDIFVLAARLMNFNIQSGAGWPYDVTSGLVDGVSYVFPDDLYSNTKELHQKMFGQEDYEPTDLVLTMSNQIINDISSSAEETKKIDTRTEEENEKKSESEDKTLDKDEEENSETTDDESKDDDKKAEDETQKEDTTENEIDESVSSEEPTDAEESTEPEEPTDAEETTDPEDSSDQEDPTEPETPVEPVEPVEPEQPSDSIDDKSDEKQ